jgi:hypothetical protein
MDTNGRKADQIQKRLLFACIRGSKLLLFEVASRLQRYSKPIACQERRGVG